MIIAIDGPAGTGKSTVAKGIAKKLGYTFFDTGAMYRSLAWYFTQAGVDPENETAVNESLSSFRFEIKPETGEQRRYFVNGTDVSTAIRTSSMSSLASRIAIYPEVRKVLVKIQREFGKKINAVFEGRDMGTVVFPEAEVKIYLTARPEVRAERRYRELLSKFPEEADKFSLEQILSDIEQRDHTDSTRKVSPLRKAPDAVLVDTSDLTADQVIERVAAIVTERVKSRPKGMHWFYACILYTARFFIRFLYGLRVYGLNHFKSGSGIIASNHASHLDPPVVSVSCPEEVHFLAKDSLFRIPLLGKLIHKLNAHPVARDAADAATFRLIISLLHSGHKVILFPEGSRTEDGDLKPIERGLPFLVMKARCRIQPVYVQGTFQIWPKGRKFPKLWGKISCVFGSPIEWSEFEDLEKRAAEKKITERVEKSLRALKQWLESGAKGSPP